MVQTTHGAVACVDRCVAFWVLAVKGWFGCLHTPFSSSPYICTQANNLESRQRHFAFEMFILVCYDVVALVVIRLLRISILSFLLEVLNMMLLVTLLLNVIAFKLAKKNANDTAHSYYVCGVRFRSDPSVIGSTFMEVIVKNHCLNCGSVCCFTLF
jgi:hypothetical protein